MLTAHFGFVRRPFGKDISTANLYLTDQHRAVLRRLEQTATHGACAALTGEVGVGKSYILARSRTHSRVQAAGESRRVALRDRGAVYAGFGLRVALKSSGVNAAPGFRMARSTMALR
jgi:type II secretory pathway predicted ATPase ExeA